MAELIVTTSLAAVRDALAEGRAVLPSLTGDAEAVERALNFADIAADNVERLDQLVNEQGDLLGFLKAYAIKGVETDGSHHKQWALIEIGRLLGVTWEEGAVQEGVEP